MLDYRFAKRFDFYIGTMYSDVTNGLSNGFLRTSTMASTMGVRFKF